MKVAGLAALLLAASPLVVGCSSDPSCEDLDDLSQQLADTDPDDSDFNDLTNKVQQAEADCNS